MKTPLLYYERYGYIYPENLLKNKEAFVSIGANLNFKNDIYIYIYIILIWQLPSYTKVSINYAFGATPF